MRTVDEATIAIRKAHTNSDPLFNGANTTLNHVNTQLDRVDGITANAQAATPAGVAAHLGEAAHELATAIGSFGADVRAGMAEREVELSEMVEQRSGVSPMARRALGAHRTDARARRAN